MTSLVFGTLARHLVRLSPQVSDTALEQWADHLKKLGRSATTHQSPDLQAHRGVRPLFEYQESVLDDIESASYAGVTRGLLSLPTGAGKTLTALVFLLRSHAERPSRFLWIAPQRVLLEQAIAELQRAWWWYAQPYPARIFLDACAPDDVGSDTTTFSFITLQRLIGLSRDSVPIGPHDVVIVDEAHYLQANEFGAALRYVATNANFVLGLSATPGRSDDYEFRALARLFGNRLFVPQALADDPVGKLIAEGVLSKVIFRKIQSYNRDETEKILARSRAPRIRSLAHSLDRFSAAVDLIQGLVASHQVLVFAYSIDHAHALAAALHDRRVPVGTVSSGLPNDLNLLQIERFRRGQLRCLTNAKYLAVGADVPCASAAVLTVPISSHILFEQVIGRVARGRRVGGSEVAIIHEFDDHLRRHGQAQSFARYFDQWQRRTVD